MDCRGSSWQYITTAELLICEFDIKIQVQIYYLKILNLWRQLEDLSVKYFRGFFGDVRNFRWINPPVRCLKTWWKRVWHFRSDVRSIAAFTVKWADWCHAHICLVNSRPQQAAVCLSVAQSPAWLGTTVDKICFAALLELDNYCIIVIQHYPKTNFVQSYLVVKSGTNHVEWVIFTYRA